MDDRKGRVPAGAFWWYEWQVPTLIAASFLALVVISLGSALGVAETIGWGRQRFKQAS